MRTLAGALTKGFQFIAALRLAVAKARAAQRSFPQALIIGSDQVAVLDGTPLSKPGNHSNATAQLRAMRGRRIEFLTALAVHDNGRNQTSERLVPFIVHFRNYSDEAIERYLPIRIREYRLRRGSVRSARVRTPHAP